ncbi:MAG: hypothetical protein HY074_04600 [Deltaproteobacteria bacterium]|nr:hypothetical protein [Deltaproteobacteria bacterium]
MQAYIGATMWDPAYAMNMNAESNPPPLPPGERGPKVTEQEQVDVNPQNEPRGPGTPNVSVAKKSTPTSTAEEPKIPLEY